MIPLNIDDIVYFFTNNVYAWIQPYWQIIGILIGIGIFGIIGEAIIRRFDDKLEFDDEPSKMFMGSSEYTNFVSQIGDSSHLFSPYNTSAGFGSGGSNKIQEKINKMVYSGTVKHRYYGESKGKEVRHILAGKPESKLSGSEQIDRMYPKNPTADKI